MPDFPSADAHKPVISSWSLEAIGSHQMNQDATTGGIGGSGAWPTANLAIYIPFAVRAPYLINTLWWANGTTATGNVDCGVYSAQGTLLVSAGSTAQSGTSAQQKVTVSGGYLLSPGSYYMALALSSTSGTIQRRGTASAPMLQLYGLAQQATSVPLNATATLATVSNAYLPLFGIAKATTI